MDHLQMSPQKLEAESHPQMRRHGVSPQHLTWCLWAHHALAQCSTPRLEQRKLLIPPACLSQASLPPSPQSSALPAGFSPRVGPVWQRNDQTCPAGAGAGALSLAVPAPSELEQGVVFPDLLQKASLVHVGFCQGQFQGLELPLQLWHLLELQETSREQGWSPQGAQ